MPGRSTTFSKPPAESAFSSVSSPKATGRAFAASSACRNFWTIPRCAAPPTGFWREQESFRASPKLIKRRNAAELSETLDRLNICFSPINRSEDLFDDPHVLRPGGLVRNNNANGEAFRVPGLPIEWNGASIGEGLKVPVLGADTSALRSELEAQEFSPTGKTAVRLA